MTKDDGLKDVSIGPIGLEVKRVWNKCGENETLPRR